MKNINFYSLCRSGHHAIIFWMINNLGGFDESYNDVFFINKKTGLYFYNNVSVRTLEHLQKFYDMNFCYATEYNWMIKNYEDELFESNVDNIVIVRDFLNLLCSRYKKWGNELGWSKKYCITNLNVLINHWKQHAVQYDTSNFISYNKWTKDKEYRNKIGIRLGAENLVDNTDYVPNFADGSSFVGLKKEINHTAYEQRYKQIKLPNSFLDIILNDSELLQLNKTIFDISITDILK